MAITVHNKLNQPLVLNLNSGRVLYLAAKGFEECSAVVTFEEFQTKQLRELIEDKFIAIRRMDSDDEES